MNWHEPLLNPATAVYLVLALAVIAALSWIVGKMLSYREPAKDEDPIERQFRDAPLARRNIDAEG